MHFLLLYKKRGMDPSQAVGFVPPAPDVDMGSDLVFGIPGPQTTADYPEPPLFWRQIIPPTTRPQEQVVQDPMLVAALRSGMSIRAMNVMEQYGQAKAEGGAKRNHNDLAFDPRVMQAGGVDALAYARRKEYEKIIDDGMRVDEQNATVKKMLAKDAKKADAAAAIRKLPKDDDIERGSNTTLDKLVDSLVRGSGQLTMSGAEDLCTAALAIMTGAKLDKAFDRDRIQMQYSMGMADADMPDGDPTLVKMALEKHHADLMDVFRETTTSKAEREMASRVSVLTQMRYAKGGRSIQSGGLADRIKLPGIIVSAPATDAPFSEQDPNTMQEYIRQKIEPISNERRGEEMAEDERAAAIPPGRIDPQMHGPSGVAPIQEYNDEIQAEEDEADELDAVIETGLQNQIKHGVIVDEESAQKYKQQEFENSMRLKEQERQARAEEMHLQMMRDKDKWHQDEVQRNHEDKMEMQKRVNEEYDRKTSALMAEFEAKSVVAQQNHEQIMAMQKHLRKSAEEREQASKDERERFHREKQDMYEHIHEEIERTQQASIAHADRLTAVMESDERTRQMIAAMHESLQAQNAAPMPGQFPTEQMVTDRNETRTLQQQMAEEQNELIRTLAMEDMKAKTRERFARDENILLELQKKDIAGEFQTPEDRQAWLDGMTKERDSRELAAAKDALHLPSEKPLVMQLVDQFTEKKKRDDEETVQAAYTAFVQEQMAASAEINGFEREFYKELFSETVDTGIMPDAATIKRRKDAYVTDKQQEVVREANYENDGGMAANIADDDAEAARQAEANAAALAEHEKQRILANQRGDAEIDPQVAAQDKETAKKAEEKKRRSDAHQHWKMIQESNRDAEDRENEVSADLIEGKDVIARLQAELAALAEQNAAMEENKKKAVEEAMASGRDKAERKAQGYIRKHEAEVKEASDKEAERINNRIATAAAAAEKAAAEKIAETEAAAAAEVTRAKEAQDQAEARFAAIQKANEDLQRELGLQVSVYQSASSEAETRMKSVVDAHAEELGRAHRFVAEQETNLSNMRQNLITSGNATGAQKQELQGLRNMIDFKKSELQDMQARHAKELGELSLNFETVDKNLQTAQAELTVKSAQIEELQQQQRELVVRAKARFVRVATGATEALLNTQTSHGDQLAQVLGSGTAGLADAVVQEYARNREAAIKKWAEFKQAETNVEIMLMGDGFTEDGLMEILTGVRQEAFLKVGELTSSIRMLEKVKLTMDGISRKAADVYAAPRDRPAIRKREHVFPSAHITEIETILNELPDKIKNRLVMKMRNDRKRTFSERKAIEKEER
jgi:hypothetical protein